MQIQKILVPFDFSEHSEKALRWAVGIAQKWEAKISLLHVIPMFTYFPPTIGEGSLNIPQFEASMQKDMERKTKEVVAKENKEGQLEIESKVKVGEPFSDICLMAEEEKVDLIVMGSHGRTGFAHVLLGSVAERVVRHAPCPVLVTGRKTSA